MQNGTVLKRGAERNRQKHKVHYDKALVGVLFYRQIINRPDCTPHNAVKYQIHHRNENLIAFYAAADDDKRRKREKYKAPRQQGFPRETPEQLAIGHKICK